MWRKVLNPSPSFWVPKGNTFFYIDAEFKATITETSTSDAAYIVAELSERLAFASQVLQRKAKADADLGVKQASKRLSLADRLKRAEAEVQSLQDENKRLRGKCSKLESTASDNEKVLESLRRTVESDTNEKAALKNRITELELAQSKVDELKQVSTGVAARAEGVYQEYKKALAALGAEPLPLPEPAEGSQVIFQLLDWMMSEF